MSSGPDHQKDAVADWLRISYGDRPAALERRRPSPRGTGGA